MLRDVLISNYADALLASNIGIIEDRDNNIDEEWDSDNQFYVEEEFLATKSSTDTNDEL